MVLKKLLHGRKSKKFRTIFIEYLLIFCMTTFLLATFLVVAFQILSSNGTILPGYFSERQLFEMKDRIASSEAVTVDLIPENCRYAVFTLEGKYISGNFPGNEATQVWNFTQVKGSKIYLNYHYLSIPRKDEICIVRYTYRAQFSSSLLRRLLPYPEILFFILFGIGFLLESFFFASLFGKKLVRKMSGMQNATEKIQNQDLEFTVESSGIVEIDNVLWSLDKMKETLKTSLKKQWRMEKERRKQISALAHDIKTPLTVVRGNVDLLLKTEQTQEQEEYTAFIKDSTNQMEQYIKTLIEISKAEVGYSLRKTPVDSKCFIDSMHSQINALVTFKKLTLDFQVHNLLKYINVDYDLLQRAIMNIVSNSVDFSPENGEVIFKVEGMGDSIRFCVVDYGQGFSSDALKNATQQFYMADKSRTAKNHYGMGLFIAKSIAEQHGGILSIDNSAKTGGGKVMIELPVNWS
ncbi:two-component sensor histidine kinase [Vallitalea longa]|uniref:histidine kinase n=1 Tax=Vallitalea longa TaxID=2936439 RepID=A0A9W5YGL7_9FIRM|nr:HAMP domain-containing sensor histidine kinase [Vallitalea longa]GKX31569.1 two-component sensor histidine kinase [Vallitalea longa]